jgi:hypothetical protein
MSGSKNVMRMISVISAMKPALMDICRSSIHDQECTS